MAKAWNLGAEERTRRLERAARAGLARWSRRRGSRAALRDPRTRRPHLRRGQHQKHADFLATALSRLDPAMIHGLHVVQSNLALSAHLDISSAALPKLDFCYSGDQGVRMARL